jgi:hypothetical protein
VAVERAPIGSKRDRYLAILVGVIVGYFGGVFVEDHYGFDDARLLTTPVGGLLAGIIARFTVPRFRDTQPRIGGRR